MYLLIKGTCVNILIEFIVFLVILLYVYRKCWFLVDDILLLFYGIYERVIFWAI